MSNRDHALRGTPEVAAAAAAAAVVVVADFC